MADGKTIKSDKVGPAKYVGQVRQEARKVVWPNWQETSTTTILVMIMVIIMGIFFFFVDLITSNSVNFFLRFFGGTGGS